MTTLEAQNTTQHRAKDSTPSAPRWVARLTAGLRAITPLQAVAGLIVLLAIAWALFPGVFTGQDPLLGTVSQRLQAPSAAHWFGTDHLGRDVLARVIYGSARSLGVTTLAVLVAGAVGTLLGLVAGYAGRAVETVIMRLVDVLQAIPSLLLSLAIVTALGTGTVPITVAVAVAAIPSFARITRGEVLRWRGSQFGQAARLDGIGPAGVLTTHVLPHAAGPVLALGALEFGNAILNVSALSFLGFGAPPPQPEWGLLVAEGRDYLSSAWWMTTLPGLVIAVVVLAVNIVARSLNKERKTA